ncbi:MAG: gamma-glutamyltransferase, partial [Gammaproteobacteria bacterium]|nr:gamma-glutamyltransferase [Gammaproteobacteria bacterium]
MRLRILPALVLAFAFHASVYAQEDQNAIIQYGDLQHPVLGRSGMVAAQNRTSAAVGAQILADGGSAVDAAIATGFSLAVTLPRAGNLGGGGFMLIHDAATNEDIAIDYREMAPQKATRDMYLDEKGNVDPEKSRFSHLASGVPGTVSGFYVAHSKYGRLPWKRLLQPAIAQARDGIVVSYDLANYLRLRQGRLCQNAATCGYYFKADGSAYEAGELLVQPDLAKSLELIADHGPDAFYK